MRLLAPDLTPDASKEIEAAIRAPADKPVELQGLVTADLTNILAAMYPRGLVYDDTVDQPFFSNGTNWLTFSLSTHVHAASAITNTPAGNIAATNVQTALNELDSEKAKLAGGNSFSGNQVIGSGDSIVFDDASGATYQGALTHSASSPYRIVTIRSRGGIGTWQGKINFDVSYNAGADYTGASVAARGDGTVDFNILGRMTSQTATLTALTTSVNGPNIYIDNDGILYKSTVLLGTIATQSAAGVNITGGSITGITDLAVADGGTGSSTAGGARTNLGLGTSAVVDTGTSGTKVALTDGANIWSAAQVFSSSAKSTSASAGVGYGTGAGGTVTQLTSKATAVTLNKICGRITTHNATLNAATSVSFTFNNNTIATTDVLVVAIQSGPALGTDYTCTVSSVGSGAATIHLRNVSAGNLSDTLVINFAVIKGVTS